MSMNHSTHFIYIGVNISIQNCSHEKKVNVYLLIHTFPSAMSVLYVVPIIADIITTLVSNIIDTIMQIILFFLWFVVEIVVVWLDIKMS